MQILFMESVQMKKKKELSEEEKRVILNNVFALSPEYFIEPDVPIAFLKTFSQATIRLEIINGINLHH